MHGASNRVGADASANLAPDHARPIARWATALMPNPCGESGVGGRAYPIGRRQIVGTILHLTAPDCT